MPHIVVAVIPARVGFKTGVQNLTRQTQDHPSLEEGDYRRFITEIQLQLCHIVIKIFVKRTRVPANRGGHLPDVLFHI